MINFAFRMSMATQLCFPTLQPVELLISKGILNRECAVRPPGRLAAAIPVLAIAIAIDPSERIAASNAQYKKFLPIPPGPSMKNPPPKCCFM